MLHFIISVFNFSLHSSVSKVIIGVPRIIIGAARIIIGTARIIIGAARIIIGTARIIIGATRIIIGAARIIIGATRIIIGATKIIIGAAAMIIGVAAMIIAAASIKYEKQSYIILFLFIINTNDEIIANVSSMVAIKIAIISKVMAWNLEFETWDLELGIYPCSSLYQSA